MKKVYKAKIQDKRGYVRFREVALTIDQYNDLLKQLQKVNANGFKLLDIWELN